MEPMREFLNTLAVMEIKLNKIDNIKNISSQECFEKLSIETNSQLIDVRTRNEWERVGVPDLKTLNKDVFFVEWPQHSSLTSFFLCKFQRNLLSEFIYSDQLFFICRSGVRSRIASEFALKFGFKHCYNVLEGFEGLSIDQNVKSGWKEKNLPWKIFTP